MSDQIKYFLRPGETAQCEAQAVLGEDYSFKAVELMDIYANMSNDRDGYKVQYEPRNGVLRPYIMIGIEELRYYAAEILNYRESSMSEGKTPPEDTFPTGCYNCSSVFPLYWTYNEPLCPFCKKPHGVTK